jgi:MFS family permease
MGRWPLLRHRDFMLLWGGEVLSELGSQTSTVAYPLLILALTGSAAKAGVVGLAKWLPLALFAVPAGVLADRLNRKRLMIACDAIRMVAAASIIGPALGGLLFAVARSRRLVGGSRRDVRAHGSGRRARRVPVGGGIGVRDTLDQLDRRRRPCRDDS